MKTKFGIVGCGFLGNIVADAWKNGLLEDYELVVISIGAFADLAFYEEVKQAAKEVVLYRDIPASDEEIVRRIGDADAVLVSYTSRIGKNVHSPNVSAGRTKQAFVLLSQKVLANLETALKSR